MAFDFLKKWWSAEKGKQVPTAREKLIKMWDFLSALAMGGYDLSTILKMEEDLVGRYMDYEDMNDYPDLSSALDIYADETSQPNIISGETVWVESDDENLAGELNDMFSKIYLDDHIWSIARGVCMYGNEYHELLLKENEGLCGLSFLAQPTMRCVIDLRGDVIGFIQNIRGQFSPMTEKEFRAKVEGKQTMGDGEIVFEDWQAVHFKLGARQRWDVYGRGVLDPARWIWRRLVLMEDAALIYRLTRAPARFAFYIDVGKRSPAEAENYIQRQIAQFRKKKFVNPNTGKLDTRYNPLASDEDFFVATRDGKKATEIESIGGLEWNNIEDIEYFKDKLYAAIKIPKSYLGFEEDVSAKNILASEDVRFARTILRIQRSLREGFNHMCKIHLAARGIDPDKTAEFDSYMSVPSLVFEKNYMDVLSVRANVASQMREYVSMEWILKNIFHFSDEEIRDYAVAKGGATGEIPPEEWKSKTPPQTEVDFQKQSERILGVHGTNRQNLMLETKMRRALLENKELQQTVKVLKPLMLEIRETVRGYGKYMAKGGRR
jgi:hypothetical protein